MSQNVALEKDSSDQTGASRRNTMQQFATLQKDPSSVGARIPVEAWPMEQNGTVWNT
jgi:hypothetical protein